MASHSASSCMASATFIDFQSPTVCEVTYDPDFYLKENLFPYRSSSTDCRSSAREFLGESVRGIFYDVTAAPNPSPREDCTTTKLTRSFTSLGTYNVPKTTYAEECRCAPQKSTSSRARSHAGFSEHSVRDGAQNADLEPWEQSKLRWVDALSTWIPDTKPSQAYVTFVQGAPVRQRANSPKNETVMHGQSTKLSTGHASHPGNIALLRHTTNQKRHHSPVHIRRPFTGKPEDNGAIPRSKGHVPLCHPADKMSKVPFTPSSRRSSLSSFPPPPPPSMTPSKSVDTARCGTAATNKTGSIGEGSIPPVLLEMAGEEDGLQSSFSTAGPDGVSRDTEPDLTSIAASRRRSHSRQGSSSSSITSVNSMLSKGTSPVTDDISKIPSPISKESRFREVTTVVITLPTGPSVLPAIPVHEFYGMNSTTEPRENNQNPEPDMMSLVELVSPTKHCERLTSQREINPVAKFAKPKQDSFTALKLKQEAQVKKSQDTQHQRTNISVRLKPKPSVNAERGGRIEVDKRSLRQTPSAGWSSNGSVTPLLPPEIYTPTHSTPQENSSAARTSTAGTVRSGKNGRSESKGSEVSQRPLSPELSIIRENGNETETAPHLFAETEEDKWPDFQNTHLGSVSRPSKSTVRNRTVRKKVKQERRLERKSVVKTETPSPPMSDSSTPSSVNSNNNWIFVEDSPGLFDDVLETEVKQVTFADIPLPSLPVKASTSKTKVKSEMNLPPTESVKQPPRRRSVMKGSYYEDERRRQELAEERRKKQLTLLERHRQKAQKTDKWTNGEGDNGSDTGYELSFEDFDFLAKYCIFDKGSRAIYKEAFQSVNKKRKWLSGQEVITALSALNTTLSRTEDHYLRRILELMGYNVSRGADFKLFSVIAALSKRISSLDPAMKNLIGNLNFKTLEMKMYLWKALWECNVDTFSNTLSLDQLCVELRAGGVSDKHVRDVREKLSHLTALDLLDFLTYIPLFIMIHEAVVDNPLSDSREK